MLKSVCTGLPFTPSSNDNQGQYNLHFFQNCAYDTQPIVNCDIILPLPQRLPQRLWRRPDLWRQFWPVLPPLDWRFVPIISLGHFDIKRKNSSSTKCALIIPTGKLYFGDWFQFHQDYWENLVKPAARAPSVVSPDSDSSPSSSSSSSSPFSSPSSSPSFSPGCRTRCCQPSPSKRLKKTVTPPSKAQLRQTANLTLRLNGQTGRVLREVSNITRDISTDSRCYHLSFENLKDNFVGAMAGLANFLQCSQSTQFYQVRDIT